MAGRFRDVGVPGEEATSWFAALLRDGFALTVAGERATFAEIGAEALRVALHGKELTTGLDDAVDHVMGGFAELGVHPDVPEGLRALRALGIRLVTLSNGSTSIAEGLLGRAGVADQIDRFLSVDGSGMWKPAAGAYAYGVAECDVDPAAAMLVAVHPWDTDGAARAGLASAWINRGDGLFPRYFRAPDLEAASLVDLAQQLG
jgi:2-haloacid dehalogenase